MLDVSNAIAKCEVPYPADPPVSPELRDLFSRIFVKDPLRRITLQARAVCLWGGVGPWGDARAAGGRAAGARVCGARGGASCACALAECVHVQRKAPTLPRHTRRHTHAHTQTHTRTHTHTHARTHTHTRTRTRTHARRA